MTFFEGSGTVGGVCIKEGRNCLMCDNDKTSIEYFEKHLSLMRKSGQDVNFKKVENIEEFFDKIQKERL